MKSKARERVWIVGVRLPGTTRDAMRISLDELARLVDTADGVVVGELTQELHKPHPATLLNTGKIRELAELAQTHDCSTVAVDALLTPAQQRNLQKALNCKVLDRTAIILDIFAKHAQDAAGKLQVELAQLQYQLPRLAGSGGEMMQQAGYIGNRGPGETKLELDRRTIRERMQQLRRDLVRLKRQRATQRERRAAMPTPLIALVGYTNAGKSTLLNSLTGAGVLSANQLFSTLDPRVRRVRLPSGRIVLLADTVGLIRNLPHQLVEAFHATFEEIAHASLIAIVVDANSTHVAQEYAVVKNVLQEMQLDQIPQLLVLNKSDLPPNQPLPYPHALAISALAGSGLTELREKIDELLRESLTLIDVIIPHAAHDLLHACYTHGVVVARADCEDGVHLQAWVATGLAARLRATSYQ